MTEKEIKDQLREQGVSEEVLASVDYGKIAEIVSNAASIDDLCAKIKLLKPDIDENALKNHLMELSENSSDESEVAEDLSEEQLEAVAGGSVGSWLKKNAYWLVPTIFSASLIGVTIAQGVTNHIADKDVAMKSGFNKETKIEGNKVTWVNAQKKD